MERTSQEWPTHHLRKDVEKFKLQIPLQNFPLGDKWTDITKQKKNCAFAKKYEPKILLQGQGLISEECSELWGGMLFRVLQDKEGTKRVIQYIYVWSKQQFPLTYWNWLLPLFALFLISIYTTIDTEIYRVDLGSVEGIYELVTRIGTSDFHPWFLIIVSLILIVFFGGYELIKYWKTRAFSIRLIIFPLLGLFCLGCIVLELLLNPIFPSPFLKVDLSYIFHFYNVTTDMSDLVINIGVLQSCLCLLLIGSILILYYKLIERVFNLLNIHISHDMDYAPIFMYLVQSNDIWRVDAISWDKLHYKAGLANQQGGKKIHKLNFLEKKNDEYHPRMILKGNWHSFEPLSLKDRIKGLFLWYFWFGVLLGLLLLGLFLTVSNLNVFGAIENFLEPSWANFIPTVLYRVLYPVVLLWCVYYFVTRRKRPFLSPNDQNLCQLKYYHLSPEKCQILWSLPSEPQFLIQEKLQNPLQVQEYQTFRNENK